MPSVYKWGNQPTEEKGGVCGHITIRGRADLTADCPSPLLTKQMVEMQSEVQVHPGDQKVLGLCWTLHACARTSFPGHAGSSQDSSTIPATIALHPRKEADSHPLSQLQGHNLNCIIRTFIPEGGKHLKDKRPL